MKWDRERYEAARLALLREDQVMPYRCRGGGLQPIQEVSLPRVDTDALERARADAEKEAEEAAKLREKSEKELYPYIKDWALKQGYRKVEITGELHRRDWWENPDLIAVDEIDLEWTVGPAREVTTIEAKLAFDVSAVWQAANYRQFSHMVYLACFEDPPTIREKLDGRLHTQCVDLGLGIISMRPAGAGGIGVACLEINAPRKQSPAPTEVDRLLSDYAKELKLVSPYKKFLKKAAGT